MNVLKPTEYLRNDRLQNSTTLSLVFQRYLRLQRIISFAIALLTDNMTEINRRDLRGGSSIIETKHWKQSYGIRRFERTPRTQDSFMQILIQLEEVRARTSRRIFEDGIKEKVARSHL